MLTQPPTSNNYHSSLESNTIQSTVLKSSLYFYPFILWIAYTTLTVAVVSIVTAIFFWWNRFRHISLLQDTVLPISFKELIFLGLAIVILCISLLTIIIYYYIQQQRRLKHVRKAFQADISPSELLAQQTPIGQTEFDALFYQILQLRREYQQQQLHYETKQLDLQNNAVFSENLIRTIQIGIVSILENGMLHDLNPAARTLLKPSFIDFQNRHFTQAFAALPLEAREKMSLLIQKTLEGGPEYALEQLHTDRHILDIHVIGVLNKAGLRSGPVVMLMEDVTLRENTKQRLLQSEQLATIGRWAAQVTHEVRNPLSSISLNIELLGDDLDFLPLSRRPEAQDILLAVRKEIVRLSHITEGYLRFARLQESHRETAKLEDTLAELVAFCHHDATRRGIHVEYTVLSSISPFFFDPHRLHQAILNLLRNALEAAGSGGSVRVSIGTQHEQALIRIEDSGPGIDPDIQERIFEPFYTTKQDGTGIGLSLVRDVVQEHQGQLRVFPSALGGAGFEICLPTLPPNR